MKGKNLPCKYLMPLAEYEFTPEGTLLEEVHTLIYYDAERCRTVSWKVWGFRTHSLSVTYVVLLSILVFSLLTGPSPVLQAGVAKFHECQTKGTATAIFGQSYFSNV
jgi:hypothetical protein